MKRLIYITLLFSLLISFSVTYASVDYSRLTDLEILKGDEDGLRLDDIVTRKELAVIIARVSGEAKYAENYPVRSLFQDVEESYYSSFISWAYSKGFFSDISNKKFRPDETVGDKDFERAILKVLGYNVPDSYIKYKAKELDIDIQKTDGISRKMMADSISRALDVKLKDRNITLYENLLEKRKEKIENQIINLETVSATDMIVEFSERIDTSNVEIKIVDKKNPFKKLSIKNIMFLSDNKYIITVSRLESDNEYYLSYKDVNYPFSPQKNISAVLNVKEVEVIDKNKIYVKFNNRLIPDSALKKENYVLEGLDIISVDLCEDISSVVITTEKMTNEEYYNFYLENVIGLGDSKLERVEYVVKGYIDNKRPKLISANITSNNVLEIVFSDKSGIDLIDLLTLDNFKIKGKNSVKTIDSIVTSKTDIPFETKVRIKTKTYLDESEYNLEINHISDNSIVQNSIENLNVSVIQNSIDINGPEIVRVEALGRNKINVVIRDENSIDNKSIFDAGNYFISGDIQVTNIILDSDNHHMREGIMSIILETTNMSKDKEYSIYLKNIKDIYDNYLHSEEVRFFSKTVDNVSPKVSEIKVIDKNTISIKFDEKINRVNSLNNENYLIDNLVGNPNEVSYNETDNTLILKVSDLEKSKEYLLSVKNIMDYNMNEMGTKSYSFVYSYQNTEYKINGLEFLDSNLVKVDFNSNVDNTDDLKLILEDVNGSKKVEFQSVWYRIKDKSVVFFKSDIPLKTSCNYRISNISKLYIEQNYRNKLYYYDYSTSSNRILSYKILGNNEMTLYFNKYFYVMEDEINENVIQFDFNPENRSLNLKFRESFSRNEMYLDLSYVKSIDGKSLYNKDDYKGLYKFVLNFNKNNPIEKIKVYNFYNISIFHNTPVFGKYYKIINLTKAQEMKILNVGVDSRDSKKVNLLISDRLEEDDDYSIVVYNDSQYTSESESKGFDVDFDQYLVAKVIDNDTIEIYDEYVNLYEISLYQVDSNYKKIGSNLVMLKEEKNGKYVVKSTIELLENFKYLLDYGESQIYLNGKAETINGQISMIADRQYTGKVLIEGEKIIREEDKKYQGKLYKIDSMEEITMYDGVDNQFLITEPINVGDKVLFRWYENDNLKYSSQLVVKDDIKDYYDEYFERINSFDPNTIIKDLIDLSNISAYISRENILPKNALYYIDNLKIKNEYTIYELYSIIKGVNAYYGSGEKLAIEDQVINFENFTYSLDDDMTISYCASNYGLASNNLKKMVDALPLSEKSEYTSRVNKIEQRITESVSINKIVVGREKMLNKKESETYFTPKYYNIKGVELLKSLKNDNISINSEWKILKYDESSHKYVENVDNLSIISENGGVKVVIIDEESSEGIYKIHLKINQNIFGKENREVLGEGELIIQ